ncbi:uncharacterized protein LOC128984681 isoform X1 [Macrosteles quadrilineatus]|uniref:uncharacterized protein LOC128984681 isoform X1 n=1 Tax=Macrosteles quadrilineatus TaxID=74068 RepID=UPI0023E0A0F4|nr:uncharacterized protein LOC128984681 isoform X1 [Macrosteles quadrilineatus]
MRLALILLMGALVMLGGVESRKKDLDDLKDDLKDAADDFRRDLTKTSRKVKNSIDDNIGDPLKGKIKATKKVWEGKTEETSTLAKKKTNQLRHDFVNSDTGKDFDKAKRQTKRTVKSWKNWVVNLFNNIWKLIKGEKK